MEQSTQEMVTVVCQNSYNKWGNRKFYARAVTLEFKVNSEGVIVLHNV